MATVNVSYTATATSAVLTDTTFPGGTNIRQYVYSDGIDVNEDIVLRIIREEFIANGTASGVVTVTAV